MTLGDRLSILTRKYMNINQMEDNDVYDLLHHLFDLYDEAEQEGEWFYVKESLYIAYKILVTNKGKEFIKNNKDFVDSCVWVGEVTLGFIQDLKDMDEYDIMWENTANAIIDFLNITYNM